VNGLTRQNADMEVDYKQNYTNLKRKLKFMVYEQECFQEELRRSQKKLLRVSRDKSFLLDRLLQYERVDEDSSGREREREMLPFPPEYLAPPAERMKKEIKVPKHKKETSGKGRRRRSQMREQTIELGASFNWVPRQMLSGDTAEEEGESDGDSDRGDDNRGEGEEADLVIDIPNE
uniref:INO80 complex subunit E n=1 Tax=Oncorhynchus mykiss TaxID=8022 RepID=A0A8C7M3Z2_ONCMY